MGNRYWTTGVQLGMLKGFIQSNEYEEADKLLDKIIESQMLILGEGILAKTKDISSTKNETDSQGERARIVHASESMSNKRDIGNPDVEDTLDEHKCKGCNHSQTYHSYWKECNFEGCDCKEYKKDIQDVPKRNRIVGEGVLGELFREDTKSEPFKGFEHNCTCYWSKDDEYGFIADGNCPAHGNNKKLDQAIKEGRVIQDRKCEPDDNIGKCNRCGKERKLIEDICKRCTKKLQYLNNKDKRYEPIRERYCRNCELGIGKVPDIIYTKDMVCEKCAMKLAKEFDEEMNASQEKSEVEDKDEK